MQLKYSKVIEIFDKNAKDTIANVSERIKELILLNLNESESKKKRNDTSSADL